MIKPVRLQLSRAKGFDLQLLSRATNGLPAINCARPSKWGNRFRVGHPGPPFTSMVRNRQHAVDLHHNALDFDADLIAVAKKELRGNNLACWCPDDCCHTIFLIEIANAYP